MLNKFYQPHDRIRVYVSRTESISKGPQVFMSRNYSDLLKRLFEQGTPGVYDGTAEAIGVAHEAGDRSKVVVRSIDPNIDSVGTCVGPRG